MECSLVDCRLMSRHVAAWLPRNSISTTWRKALPKSRVHQTVEFAYQSKYVLDEPVATGIATNAAASEVWPPRAKRHQNWHVSCAVHGASSALHLVSQFPARPNGEAGCYSSKSKKDDANRRLVVRRNHAFLTGAANYQQEQMLLVSCTTQQTTCSSTLSLRNHLFEEINHKVPSELQPRDGKSKKSEADRNTVSTTTIDWQTATHTTRTAEHHGGSERLTVHD